MLELELKSGQYDGALSDVELDELSDGEVSLASHPPSMSIDEPATKIETAIFRARRLF